MWLTLVPQNAVHNATFAVYAFTAKSFDMATGPHAVLQMSMFGA